MQSMLCCHSLSGVAFYAVAKHKDRNYPPFFLFLLFPLLKPTCDESYRSKPKPRLTICFSVILTASKLNLGKQHAQFSGVVGSSLTHRVYSVIKVLVSEGVLHTFLLSISADRPWLILAGVWRHATFTSASKTSCCLPVGCCYELAKKDAAPPLAVLQGKADNCCLTSRMLHGRKEWLIAVLRNRYFL